MKMLEVNNMVVRYGTLTIVNDVSFSLDEGEWLMLIGPNGAGKSTIVNAIAQSVDYSGQILYQGRDLKQFKPVELAKNIGILAQNH